MAKGYIKRTTGTTNDWEPFETNTKGVKKTTGATDDFQTAGEYYVLRRRVEDPPGTFTPEWELMATRPPQKTPSGVTLGKGPEAMGPSQHDCAWTIPPVGDPYRSLDMRVRWFLSDVLDATSIVAVDTGGVSRTYDVIEDVHVQVAYLNDIGAGTEVRAPSSGYI